MKPGCLARRGKLGEAVVICEKMLCREREREALSLSIQTMVDGAVTRSARGME